MEYNYSSRLFDARKDVKELELTVNNLPEAEATLSAINQSKTLKKLSLFSRGLDHEINVACKRALNGSSVIETVILDMPECSDKGLCGVVITLKTILRLKSLTLRLNNVTEEGARALADLLESKEIESFAVYGTQN